MGSGRGLGGSGWDRMIIGGNGSWRSRSCADGEEAQSLIKSEKHKLPQVEEGQRVMKPGEHKLPQVEGGQRVMKRGKHKK